MRGAISDQRMGLQFTRTIAFAPCQSSNSLVQVPQNSRPYFTVSYETPLTWRARSSYLYQGGPVIPPGTELLFIPSYDSQGYRGGILTHVHTGCQNQSQSCHISHSYTRTLDQAMSKVDNIKICTKNWDEASKNVELQWKWRWKCLLRI
jgi:hypothetical protein